MVFPSDNRILKSNLPSIDCIYRIKDIKVTLSPLFSMPIQQAVIYLIFLRHQSEKVSNFTEFALIKKAFFSIIY